MSVYVSLCARVSVCESQKEREKGKMDGRDHTWGETGQIGQGVASPTVLTSRSPTEAAKEITFF